MIAIPNELVPAERSDIPDLLTGRLTGWFRTMLPTGHPYFPQNPDLDPTRDLSNQRLLFAWGYVPVQCLGSDLETLEIRFDDNTTTVPIQEISVSCCPGSHVRNYSNPVLQNVPSS